MTQAFETEKNRKAFIYTAIICGALLLLFFIIKWKVLPPTVPIVQDLIEINLGSEDEGFGEEQPLVKGSPTPARAEDINDRPINAPAASDDIVNPEDDAEKDAAPVNKPVKTPIKIKKDITPSPVVTPAPKPQKPKITMTGLNNGQPGNNPTDDNGFTRQGSNPNGKGDPGDPKGNKDSYGTTPGGRVGGPKIIRGNRKIVRYYSFTGELPKATIYAIIRVSAEGKGRFIAFDKGSTSRNQGYADAISNYLRSMLFDKAPEESNVTVQFNFSIN